MKPIQFLDKRILLIVGLVVLVLLMSDFSSRVGELRRLGEQKSTVAARVTQLAATQHVLKVEIAYATSAAAVEAWARQDAHMYKPGDVPIVPLAPAGSTPVPQVIQAPTVEVVPNWQVWYTLFLGK
jgi:cell division protein FtsB